MQTPTMSSPNSELGFGDLSRSSSSDMGDYIGMESCIDLNQCDEEVEEMMRSWCWSSSSSSSEGMDRAVGTSQRGGAGCGGKRDQRLGGRGERRKKREYPPPIPLLAWVMKRYYTDDGRLIIREEKVRHQDYFRAHRANGRLTLHLVPLNVDVWAVPTEDDDQIVVQDDDDGKEVGGDGVVEEEEEEERDRTVEEEEEEGDRTVVMGGKWCDMNQCSSRLRRSASCIFGMTVPAVVRPVHNLV